MRNGRNGSLTKRAIECLSIVTKRYYYNPTEPQPRRSGVEAMRRMGNIYMTYVLDYRAAYKNLTLARQIAEEDGLTDQLAYIYLSLSNLYHINTTVTNTERLTPLTNEAISKALDAAIISENGKIISTVILNMLLTTFFDDSLRDSYRDEFEKFKRYKFTSPSNDERMSRLLLQGMEAYCGQLCHCSEINKRGKASVAKSHFLV